MHLDLCNVYNEITPFFPIIIGPSEGVVAMEVQNPHFNRNLLIVVAVLYVLTIAIFVYPMLASEPGFTEWWMMPVNLLIISIPLVLLYGSIYVLVRGWYERSTVGEVSPRLTKVIHWAPRVAAIMIIFFTSLFSLDVFGMGASLLEVLGAFLMHNIPSIIMVIFLVFAWKRPFVGFVVFLIAGIAFAIFFVRDLYALPNLLLFVFPILMIASLFYADWKWLNPSNTT
jgi:hypothetical protein